MRRRACFMLLLLLALPLLAPADPHVVSGYDGERYVRTGAVPLCRDTSVTLRYSSANSHAPGLLIHAQGRGAVVTAVTMLDGRVLLSAYVTLNGRLHTLAATLRPANSSWQSISLHFADPPALHASPSPLTLFSHVEADSKQNSNLTPNATFWYDSKESVLSDVYLGGVPSDPSFVPPATLFRANFVGNVQLVISGPCASLAPPPTPHPRRPMLSACKTSNVTCLHGGFCVDNQLHSAAQCDCRRTRFFGPHCEHAKLSGSASVAMSASSCLRLRLADSSPSLIQLHRPDSHAIVAVFSLFEIIELTFRTVERDALLFYIACTNDFFALTMSNGHLRLTTRINGRLNYHLLQHKHNYSLDNSKWHEIKFERRDSSMTLLLGNETLLQRTIGASILALTDVWLGGVPVSRVAEDLIDVSDSHRAFRGLMKDVIVTISGMLPIDCVTLLREQHPLVTAVSLFGKLEQTSVSFDTKKVPESVRSTSFEPGHSGVTMHNVWSTTNRSDRSLTLQFHSIETQGTVFFHADYLLDTKTPYPSAIMRLFAIELFDNHTYVTIAFCDTMAFRVRLPVNINIHASRTISLSISDRLVKVRSHSFYETFSCNRYSNTSPQQRSRSVTVIGDSYAPNDPQISRLFKSSLLLSSFSENRRKFHGCIEALWLDGALVDLRDLVTLPTSIANASCPVQRLSRRPDKVEFPSVGFLRSGALNANANAIANANTNSVQCQNGGRFVQLYKNDACDCSATDYDGELCDTLTPTLTLDNSGSFLKIDLPSLQQAEANEVTLRFRAIVSNATFGGVLLLTSSPDSNDHLCVFVDRNGLFRVKMDLGSTWFNLSDSTLVVTPNEWHNVRVTRVLISNGQHQMTIFYDSRKVFDKILLGNSTSLEFMSVLLGNHRYSKAWQSPIFLPADLLELDDLPSFAGQLQHVTMNDRKYLKAIYEKRETEMRFSYELNADISLASKALLYPLTIPVENTTVKQSVDFNTFFNSSRTNFDTNIRFLLKTTLINGVFAHAQCLPTDSKAAEMIDVRIMLQAGKVTLWLDIDGQLETDAYTLTSQRGIVNDDKWHSINVHLSNRVASVTVDEHSPASLTFTDQNELQLPKAGRYECFMYVGGTVNDQLGFRGCMASLEVNRQLIDLASGEKLSKDVSVTSGLLPVRTLPSDYCVGRSSFDICSTTSCKNGGLRIASFDTCRCDCSMTSFTGSTCSKYSTTFKFEPSEESHTARTSNAVIVYDYPAEERRDRRIDMISFGLSTLLADCFILSLETTKKQQKEEFSDFLEVLLIDGYITVRYNLGSGDRRLLARSYVADGSYHSVRLLRNGSNASLQIDDGAIYQSTANSAKSHTYFNAQNRLVIGKAPTRPRRLRELPDFVGLLSGLYVNNMNVLDEVSGLRRTNANVTVGSNVTKVNVAAYFGERADDEGQADSPNNYGRTLPLFRSTPPNDAIIVAHRECPQLSDATPVDCISPPNAIVRPTNKLRRRSTTVSSTTTRGTAIQTGKEIPTDYVEEYEEESSRQPEITVTNDYSTIQLDDEGNAETDTTSVSRSHNTEVTQSEETPLSQTTSELENTEQNDASDDQLEKGKVELATPRYVSFASSLNMLLIVGVAAGCILVSAVASIVAYKCFRKKDSGTYKVDSNAAEHVALRPATRITNKNGDSSISSCSTTRLSATLPRPVMNSQPSSILKNGQNGRVHSATIHHVVARSENGSALHEQLLNQEWYV